MGKKKICLDPGHGTAEMNQSPDGRYIEYKFALDMGGRIRKHLTRCGFDVKLTKEDESTPGLSARANVANTWGADLYVSLHSNATGGGGWNAGASGWTIWICALGGEREKAARAILASTKEAGIKTFGSELYTSNFTVLTATKMPAVLIEYMFHTHQDDVKLLLQDEYREKMAVATAKGICRYYDEPYVEEEAAPPPAATTVYRVQVGAFSVKKNAEALMDELKKKGYNPITVISEK